MKAKAALGILVVLVVAGALAGIKTLQIRKMLAAAKQASQPPEHVSTTIAREEKWPNSLTAIGSVRAVQGIVVTPEVPGLVREIKFEAGALAAKGDLLLRLDTCAEEAQLRGLEAALDLARLNIKRMRSLRADSTVSQADLDAAEATLKQSEASADTLRTTIEKKNIRAPFSGKLGIRLVNLGEYLDMGKPIVSLQSLAPVYTDFALPQQELARLKTGMPVRVTTDAYPGEEFEGTLTAINPEVDAVMRTVGLQATFENAGQVLRPGMFARVEVRLPEEQNVLAIPATSVLSAPYGDSVYVIEEKQSKDGKVALVVRQQFIRVGAARGDFVSVESGLKTGQKIANAGVFKLRNGMTVIENNRLAPQQQLAPRPADS